jgi:2,3-diketo-5-methylthio-1-phosphopentane phosphatase/HAD superfamily hydrolase (TIGR01549 family)
MKSSKFPRWEERRLSSPELGARKTLILCDFDGTVSLTDTVNLLIERHSVGDEWRHEVKRYMKGEIGSLGVYEAVAPLMRATEEGLAEFTRETARLDPGFLSFLSWAKRRGADVKIVSDGFDVTIRNLLCAHGVNDMEIYANRLLTDSKGRVTIEFPYADSTCGRCGACKRSLVRRLKRNYDFVVLVGDGVSDRHAAEEADLVLALKDLFVYCVRMGIPAMRMDGFDEAPRLLERRIEAVTFDLDGTLLDSLDGIAEAFNYMFGRLGYPPMTVDEVARKTSISLKDFVATFLRPDESERGIRIFRDYYDSIYIEKTRMLQGANQALRRIGDEVKTGIVTNKKGTYARSLAAHFGFADTMALIIGAEDGFKAKPAPDMLHEFLRATGSNGTNAVYVGDAPIDIETARNAGIDAIAICGPVFSAEELALHRPRRVLSGIGELPDALAPVL